MKHQIAIDLHIINRHLECAETSLQYILSDVLRTFDIKLDMKDIGIELGFGVHLCLNLAGHSYATKQRLDGYAVAACISNALEHSNINNRTLYEIIAK